MLLKFEYKGISEMFDSFESANRHLIWPDPEAKNGAWMQTSTYTVPLLNRDVAVYEWVEGNFFD
jgi:hypothetical protein